MSKEDGATAWLKRETRVNNPLVRILARVTAVATGAPIDKAVGVLDELHRKDVSKRLAALEASIEALGQDSREAIGHEYLESEDFRGLFRLTVREVENTTRQEKIGVFAQFLANGTTECIKGIYPGVRQAMLRHVARLSMGHLVLLKALADQEPDIGDADPELAEFYSMVPPLKDTAKEYGLSEEEMNTLLFDMKASGLVYYEEDTGLGPSPGFGLEPLGETLLAFIAGWKPPVVVLE